jgi:enoyl-CoA hydratase
MRSISYTAVKLAVEGTVALVTLDSPGDGNRVNEVMAAELRESCAELSAANGLRVVILTGNGPVFSTGRHTSEYAGQIGELRAARAVGCLPMPVIVALNGDATDHGLELALAGDLRVAASDAKFGFSAPSAGNIPFDGGTQRLPRLVGPGWARDMLLTGRMVDAKEALTIGLVNRVVEYGEDVMKLAWQLAGQLAEGSPLGARYIKEAVASGSDMTLGQGIALETDLNVILQSTGDRAEGIASFLERRAPEFTGE